MKERLQKVVAAAGISSRRAAEELILAGRVWVNGRPVVELGAKADPDEDDIEVDGKRLQPPTLRYVVLHKPRGMVSTMRDPEGRPTVAELLARVPGRLYPVGRLDFATSGVLLATNDGAFANGLLHPKGGVPKTYVVKVQGEMSPADLNRWARGVDLDDGRTAPADVHFLRHEEGKTWFEVTLREGRNQQIRRMGEATGYPVMRLARLSFAGITSEGLRPGELRVLTMDELRDLREEYGVPKKVRPAAPMTPASSRHRPHRVEDAGPPKGRAANAPRGRGTDAPRGRNTDAPRGRTADAPRGRGTDAPRGRTADAPRGRTANAGAPTARRPSAERAAGPERRSKPTGERPHKATSGAPPGKGASDAWSRARGKR